MEAITGFGNDMLKFNGVKVTLDGVPATFTSLMRKPYRNNPETYGSTVWTKEEITAFVCKANELNWQFGIHAIGDATEDMALEAFAAAHKQKPITDALRASFVGVDAVAAHVHGLRWSLFIFGCMNLLSTVCTLIYKETGTKR